MPVSLTISPKGKPLCKLPQTITLPSATSTTSELYSSLASKTGVSTYQLRITTEDGSVVHSDSKTLKEAGIQDGAKLHVKDLGLQIGWQTMYLMEYLGPLILHPLIYFLRPYIYANPNFSSFPEPSKLQRITMYMIVAHYAKRELETLFVHKFSAASMPLKNIIKNWGHYWGLSGLVTAYFLYSPTSLTAGPANGMLAHIGLLAFGIGELGNLYCHVYLSQLRSRGGRERQIPTAWPFRFVTCPNYGFEALAWIGVTVFSVNWAVAIFALVGVVQMYFWAAKKERNYRKEFGDRYKRKRSVMVPGVL